jgi:hypothetical protein
MTQGKWERGLPPTPPLQLPTKTPSISIYHVPPYILNKKIFKFNLEKIIKYDNKIK